jgi:hypothetical protein
MDDRARHRTWGALQFIQGVGSVSHGFKKSWEDASGFVHLTMTGAALNLLPTIAGCSVGIMLAG